MAQHIPGAKLIELSGEDHSPWIGDRDALLDEVEQFLTGRRHSQESERVLATVLFVDIVGSTKRAVAIGDRPWRETLETFYSTVREVLQRYRGREIILQAMASLLHSTDQREQSAVRAQSVSQCNH